jgi:ABC-type maltose transport system permease subunit
MSMTKSQRRHAFSTFRYLVLTVWLLIVAFPIFWMVSTSFKPDREWFAWPPVYISENATIQNYLVVWADVSEYATDEKGELETYTQSLQRPWEALGNSALISIISTTLTVLFGSVLAYGVSRYGILSEGRMFQLLMLRMVPPIVLIAPISIWYSALGLLDSITGLVMLYFLTTLPYAVWMSKSFIDEVPREMEPHAHDMGSCLAAGPFGAGRDLPVHSDFDLERVSAGPAPVEDRGGHAAGRIVEVSRLDGRPRLWTSGRPVRRHHSATHRGGSHDPQASRTWI